MAQGLTADKGIVVLDSRERRLLSQRNFLVTITRLRDKLTLIVALSPAWSSWLALPEDLHVWLLAMALPFSGIGLWRTTKRCPCTKLSLGLGVAGLALMSAGFFAERGIAEVVVTTAGAILVAIAHLRNWRCRGHQVSTRHRSSANR